MEKKIRIFYIIRALNIGGTEKALIDSINGLNSDKYEARIVSLTEYDAEKTVFRICAKPENVKILYLNFKFHDDYSLFGYLKVLLRSKNTYTALDEIISEIKSFGPDIIHFHTGPRELRLKKFFNYNAVYVFTDQTLRITEQEIGAFRARLLSRLFKKLYSGYHVIAVSQQVHKNLLQFDIPDPSKKNTVIINCVDTDRFTKKTALNFREGLKAVYISRIDYNKGHEDLVRAWADLKDIPDKKLFIVGPDQLDGEIQKLAQEVNCSESIVFTGSVSDPQAFLEDCNLGIFPSHKEGLPLSLLEKMSMALPLAISDIPELSSVCKDKEDALFFKTGNVNSISEIIRSIYSNPELAETLGKNARNSAIKNYSAASITKLLDNFYSSLLSSADSDRSSKKSL